MKTEGEVLFTAKRFHVKWTKDEVLAAKSSVSIPIVASSITFESGCCTPTLVECFCKQDIGKTGHILDSSVLVTAKQLHSITSLLDLFTWLLTRLHQRTNKDILSLHIRNPNPRA